MAEDPIIMPPVDWADYLDGETPGSWEDLTEEEQEKLRRLFGSEDDSEVE